jgi:parallel beta-helix repeat protein
MTNSSKRFYLFTIFSVAALLVLLLSPLRVFAKSELSVHNMDTGLNYATIQEAIDVPETADGHTIIIDPGTYYENVVLSKSLALVGYDRETTIIDGDKIDCVIRVVTSSATISNLTLRNGYEAGIDITGFDGNKISDNVVSNNIGHGIKVSNSNNNSLMGNIIFSNSNGIFLQQSADIIIKNNDGSNNKANGITIGYCHNCLVVGNDLSENAWSGIDVYASANNTFDKNTVLSNGQSGISLETIKIENNTYPTTSNQFLKNNVLDNSIAVSLLESSDNTFLGNNFVNNTQLVHDEAFGGGSSSANTWSTDYCQGGNYWGSPSGVDQFCGSFQNVTGSDGIGDTPFVVNEYNRDNYPLMGTFSDFNIAQSYDVTTVCNSTVSGFVFDQTNQTIRFNVTGEDKTLGFCKICIPTSLMGGMYRVFINGTEVSPTILPCSNLTFACLYFTYEHSTEEVLILPEFCSITLLLLAMSFFLVLTRLLLKKKITRGPIFTYASVLP